MKRPKGPVRRGRPTARRHREGESTTAFETREAGGDDHADGYCERKDGKALLVLERSLLDCGTHAAQAPRRIQSEFSQTIARKKSAVLEPLEREVHGERERK